MEQEARVIPFPGASFEEINGVSVNMAGINLDELVKLEQECTTRYEDAHWELLIVRDALAKRTHGGNAS